MEPAVNDACGVLLTRIEPAATDLLVVTTDRSADECLAAWQSRADEERLPARAGIVSVGADTRSAGSDSPSSGFGAGLPSGRDAFYRTVVPEPGELTGLGMRVSRALETWCGERNVPVLCVRSLTDLLLYADRSRVFRFLHIVTGLVEAAGGVVHYHMCRDPHGDRTLATFRSLLDVTFSYRDDNWRRA